MCSFRLRLAVFGSVFCASLIYGKEKGAVAPQQQDTYESFCGLDAAKAAASLLAKPWLINASTKNLESHPISQFHELSDAMESLGLHCDFISIKPSNFNSIVTKFESNSGHLVAIAWTPSNLPELQEAGIGHFVVVDGAVANSAFRTFDPQSNQVASIKMVDEMSIPLLLISDSNALFENDWRADIWRLISSFALTGVIVSLIIVRVLIMRLGVQGAFDTGIVKATLYSGLAIAMLLALFLFKFRVSENVQADASLKVEILPDSDSVCFSSEKYDFGDLNVGAIETRSVQLRNRSRESIEGVGIKGSCTCFSLEPRYLSLAPSTDYKITVHFHGLVSGSESYQIFAFTGNDELASCEIKYEGVVGSRLLPLRSIGGQLSRATPVLQLRFKVDEYYSAPISDFCLVSSTASAFGFELLPNQVFERNGQIIVEATLVDLTAPIGVNWSTLKFHVTLGEERITLGVDVGIEIVETLDIPNDPALY